MVFACIGSLLSALTAGLFFPGPVTVTSGIAVFFCFFDKFFLFCPGKYIERVVEPDVLAKR